MAHPFFGTVYSGMHYSIDAGDKTFGGGIITKGAGDPRQATRSRDETATIALGTKPALAIVPGPEQPVGDVASKETGGTGKGNVHEHVMCAE